jgi:hypothetical protein
VTKAAAAMQQAPRHRGAFLVFSLLLTAIAITGFWSSYYGPVLAGQPTATALLHLHAAVFTGWLAILVAQATLAARGRITAHRRFGRFGVFWGLLLLVVGLWTAGARTAWRATQPGGFDDAAAFLVWPLIDMIVFAAFFAAAVALRHRPQWHKRLMLVASTNLLVAPVGRLLPAPPPSAGELFFANSFATHAGYLVLWLAPLLLAAGHDLWRHGRVHPAYTIGLVVITVSSLRDQVVSLEVWRAIVRGVVGAFS